MIVSHGPGSTESRQAGSQLFQNQPLTVDNIQKNGRLLKELYPGAVISKSILSIVGAFDENALNELGPEFSRKYWGRVCKILALVAESGREGSGRRLQDTFLANRDNPEKAIELAGLFLTGILPGSGLKESTLSQQRASHLLEECGHFSAIMDGDLVRGMGGTDSTLRRQVVGELSGFLADPLLRRLLLMVRQEQGESGGRETAQYPTTFNQVSETKATLHTPACIGFSRHNHPHVSSLITLQEKQPAESNINIEVAERVGRHEYRKTLKSMSVLEGLQYVWARLVDNYPIEEAALLLDLFTNQKTFNAPDGEKELSALRPSITACHVFRPDDKSPLKLKTLMASGGAVLVISQGERPDFNTLFSDNDRLVKAAKSAGYKPELPSDSRELGGRQREELFDFVIQAWAKGAGLPDVPKGRMTPKIRSRLIARLADVQARPKIELLMASPENQVHEFLGSDYQAAHRITEHDIPDRCTLLIVPPGLAGNLRAMPKDGLETLLSDAESAGKSMAGALTSKLSEGIPGFKPEAVLSQTIDRGKLDVITPQAWTGEQFMSRPEMKALVEHLGRFSQKGFVDLKLQFGHIHADRPAGKEQLLTAPLAKSLSDALDGPGIEVEPLTLIDNLHVPDVIDYGSYAGSLQTQGLKPERILFEDALPIAYLATGICQQMMDNPALESRIRKLGDAIFLESEETNVTIFEGVRSAAGAQRGRVACVPFNWAFDYYLHDSKAIDSLFFSHIESNHPDSELTRWHKQEPDLSYHELVLKHIYGIKDPVERKAVKERVLTPLRPPIERDVCDLSPFVDSAFRGLEDASKRNEIPVVAYIIEGFYLAQWEKYSAFTNAVNSMLEKPPGLDVIRIAVDSSRGLIKPLSVKYGDIALQADTAG